MKYNFTRIWKINNRLVVADTIEDAISLYKAYTNDNSVLDITNVLAIGDGEMPQNYYAIIKA